MCGGCITMPWIDDVRGVLYAYLGGEAVGTATLDLLFGDVNPSGKLAETFPRRLEDNPSYLYFFGDEQNKTEYREGVFVGYRYYDKKNMDVLFPFGYGLSYTTFEYSNLTLDKSEMKDTDTLTVSVNVRNTGKVKGKEVVQLYVAKPESRTIRPIKERAALKRSSLSRVRRRPSPLRLQSVRSRTTAPIFPIGTSSPATTRLWRQNPAATSPAPRR